jgi:hypothetical protein
VSFVVHKVGRLARQVAWWPRCALGRHIELYGAPSPAGSQFLVLSARVRACVLTTAASDDAYVGAIRSRVAMVLDERRVPCLGYGNVPIPSANGWRADSTAGYEWPLAYFIFVNFLTHGREADVKVPWEVGRLQWLVWLAEGAVAHPELDVRVGAIAAFEGVLADWRRSNPLGYGPNWTVGMEVAIRAINIGVAAAVLWETLSPHGRTLVLRVLAEHRDFLTAFPETSDKPGNHSLLCECGRQFLDDVVFSKAPDSSERARRRAAIAAQFEADGLHVEHAPMYHRLCTEALSWSAAFSALTDGSVDSETAHLLRAASAALASLEMAAGTLPVIGDSDSGQVMSTGAATRSLLYLRQLLGLAAGNAPFIAAVAGPALGAVVDALRGERLRESRQRIGPYVRLTGGEMDVIVRAGAHGLFGRASHDHDDSGAPWVTVDDTDVLVEAGCYAYTRSPEERITDLVSTSHNLVTIGESQRFVPRAGSISFTVADAPVAAATFDDADQRSVRIVLSWVDTHVGAVQHSRRLAIDDGAIPTLEVVDELDLERACDVMVRWHFAPGWQLTLLPDGRVRAVREGSNVCVEAELAQASGVIPEIRLGDYRFSGLYGARERAAYVTATATESRNPMLTSIFRLRRVAA